MASCSQRSSSGVPGARRDRHPRAARVGDGAPRPSHPRALLLSVAAIVGLPGGGHAAVPQGSRRSCRGDLAVALRKSRRRRCCLRTRSTRCPSDCFAEPEFRRRRSCQRTRSRAAAGCRHGDAHLRLPDRTGRATRRLRDARGGGRVLLARGRQPQATRCRASGHAESRGDDLRVRGLRTGGRGRHARSSRRFWPRSRAGPSRR